MLNLHRESSIVPAAVSFCSAIIDPYLSPATAGGGGLPFHLHASDNSAARTLASRGALPVVVIGGAHRRVFMIVGCIGIGTANAVQRLRIGLAFTLKGEGCAGDFDGKEPERESLSIQPVIVVDRDGQPFSPQVVRTSSHCFLCSIKELLFSHHDLPSLS